MNQQNELTLGAEIELNITGIAHGGICVARHEGRVVFVQDAIPGETVLAEITETRKKSFARAVATKVLSASTHRRTHIWPEAGIDRAPADRVGGAEFGHISLPHQRELKTEVLIDALKRFGGLSVGNATAGKDSQDLATAVAAAVVAATGDDETNGLGYRTRVKLHVDQETGVVGPYAARSRRVVEVTNLPLANEQINLIAPLGEYLPDVQAVDVVAPSADTARSLLSYAGQAERAGANDRVLELVGEREFVVSAGGFWQVHKAAPLTLFEAVSGMLRDLGEAFDETAPNLDLYGGVGLFAAAIINAGGAGTRVTSIEADPRATDDAAENLADTVGALAITARTDRYLQELLINATESSSQKFRRATVLLDPPRSGAGGKVIETLTKMAPLNIIYVACDPVALARDTKTLSEAGYALTRIQAYDLFAHTHHFETIALFERD